MRKAEERPHIVLGLLIAQDNIDEVVRIIRSAKSVEEAKQTLSERFGLSDLQTAAIVDMRLRALVALEHGKLTAERDELQRNIAYYNDVLANESLQLQIVKEELIEIKETYGDERRSEIVYSSEEFNPESISP